MRYLLIIADGAGLVGSPEPGPGLFESLGAAQTPCLDAMGRLGKVGLASTAIGGRASFGAGALSLLGYPADRAAMVSDAVLAAAGDGFEFRPGDAMLRLGLVRVSPEDSEGLLVGVERADARGRASGEGRDTSGGQSEVRALLDDLQAHWRTHESTAPSMAHIEIVGESAERVMVVRAGEPSVPDAAALFSGVSMVDPNTVVGEPWVEHLPDGGRVGDADLLCELISASRHFLAGHPVNTARAEQGLEAINLAWVSDAGIVPDLAGLGIAGIDGGMTVVVDGDFRIGSGLGRQLGCEVSHATGDGLIDAVHGAGPGVAIVLTDRTVEAVDTEIVAPLVERLTGASIGELDDVDDADWRVLVAASHDPAGESGVADGMSPFVLAGGRVRSIVDRRLSDAMESDLRVEPAAVLLEYVLRSGLRGVG